MEFDFSPLVGRKVRGIPIEVTERLTMGFAAAVGDANPLYLDDSRDGGVVAPALFSVRLTWPLMSRLQEFYPDVIPPEILYRLVHGDLHMRVHRLVRPGDTLLVTARAVSIDNSGAGARLTLKLVGRDRTGDAVFTEFSSILFRGVRHRGPIQAIESLPELPRCPTDQALRWQAEEAICRQASHVYDACTAIHFPIHTSTSFARGVGLPDIVMHGTATLAMAVREITNRELGGDGTSILKVGAQFRHFIIPGETIAFRVLAKTTGQQGLETLFFEVMNSRDEIALRHGFIEYRRS